MTLVYFRAFSNAIMKVPQSVLILKGSESQFDDLYADIQRACDEHTILTTVDEAISHLSKKSPSLILIDLIFDDIEAIAFIAQVRQLGVAGKSLIIIFSERNENYVEIAALNAGAADYMVKPVNKYIFDSRLKSWFRQQELIGSNEDTSHILSNAVILDEEKYVAIVNQKPVELQRKEFEIMALLISKPRKVFSREEIINSVWVHRDNVNARTIDVHIRNLRSKIGPHPIKTFKGIGYSYQVS